MGFSIVVVKCCQTGEMNGVTGEVWSGRRGWTESALATSDSLTYGGSSGQSWLHNSACYKSRIRMKDCHKRDYCPFALMSQYISAWRRSPPDRLHKQSLTHSLTAHILSISIVKYQINSINNLSPVSADVTKLRLALFSHQDMHLILDKASVDQYHDKFSLAPFPNTGFALN